MVAREKIDRRILPGTPGRAILSGAAALVVLLALLLLQGAIAIGPAHATAPSLLYAQHGCTSVYAQPDTHSTILTDLNGGNDVVPLGSLGSGGSTWEHVHIWSGIDGYIASGDLAPRLPSQLTQIDCEYPGVPDPMPDVLPASHGPWPVSAKGHLIAPATLFSRPDGSSLPVSGLAVNAPVTISSWASDGNGWPWYQVMAGHQSGWVWSGDVRLEQPDPVTHLLHGKPIWSLVAGKGMWFTNYLTRHSDPHALVQAAKLAGITHLYAEVAITRWGFYGRNSLDRLLPVAHAAGISVVAWIYTNLRDVSADVRMSAQVANYVTPSGDKADGLCMDIEEVDDSASVYTYGQALRSLVGPDELFVASVYHPYAQTYYPYAAMAASWNVLAPMDYWHSRYNRAYSAANVAHFVSNSVMTVWASSTVLGTGALIPIEETGQMYDMYTDDGAGAQSAPSAEEITADMRTSRDYGCTGVSFFEWQTATQAEWSALVSFRW